MREIKFRGKLINSGKWSEGNLIIRKGNNAEIMACTSPDATPIGTYGRIDKDTIGQYTGLKDKNGKEIYEGDIIEVVFRGELEKYFVIYDESTTCFRMIAKADFPDDNFLDFNEQEKDLYEVIGNIYDNPELLEV